MHVTQGRKRMGIKKMASFLLPLHPMLYSLWQKKKATLTFHKQRTPVTAKTSTHNLYEYVLVLCYTQYCTFITKLNRRSTNDKSINETKNKDRITQNKIFHLIITSIVTKKLPTRQPTNYRAAAAEGHIQKKPRNK